MSAYLTPDQFQNVLAEIRGALAASRVVGAGAPPGQRPKLFGLGSCNCDNEMSGPLSQGIYAMLAAGSPRLALAKARGIPLAPQGLNVRVTFSTTSTSVIPDVGSDEKITQDLLVDSMVVNIQNQSTTANASVWQPISDFFFRFTSGIEATLSVQGAPRYSPFDKFTPLSTMCDVVNGGSHWPGGWVLTYQQQLKMDFNARVVLPYAPLEVVVTFRTWQPVTQSFVVMSTREAIGCLKTEFGIDLSDAYVERVIAMN